MSRNSRTTLERMPSAGSMDSTYIPDILRQSLGNALSVSRNERKRYNSAYRNASTSRKKKHIARHLRRKTERRAERKRAMRRSPIEETPVVVTPKKSPVFTRKREVRPDEYSGRSGVDNMIAASKRRTDRENMVQSFLQRKQGTKKYVNINTSK